MHESAENNALFEKPDQPRGGGKLMGRKPHSGLCDQGGIKKKKFPSGKREDKGRKNRKETARKAVWGVNKEGDGGSVRGRSLTKVRR